MSDDGEAFEGIFRREAWQQHVAQSTFGKPLLTAPRWTRPTYWLILAAVAGAFVAGARWRVADEVVAPALVDGAGGAVTIFVPAAERLRVHAGQPLELALDGSAPATAALVVDGVQDTPIFADRARQLLGDAPALPLDGAVVVASAHLTPPLTASTARRGVARLQVGSRPLLSLLAPSSRTVTDAR